MENSVPPAPAKPGDRSRTVEPRKSVNAVLHNGCPWRVLPLDLWICGRWWWQDGTWRCLHDALYSLRRHCGQPEKGLKLWCRQKGEQAQTAHFGGHGGAVAVMIVHATGIPDREGGQQIPLQAAARHGLPGCRTLSAGWTAEIVFPVPGAPNAFGAHTRSKGWDAIASGAKTMKNGLPPRQPGSGGHGAPHAAVLGMTFAHRLCRRYVVSTGLPDCLVRFSRRANRTARRADWPWPRLDTLVLICLYVPLVRWA